MCISRSTLEKVQTNLARILESVTKQEDLAEYYAENKEADSIVGRFLFDCEQMQELVHELLQRESD